MSKLVSIKPPAAAFTLDSFEQMVDKVDLYWALKSRKFIVNELDLEGVSFKQPESCGEGCDCFPSISIPLSADNDFVKAKTVRIIKATLLEGIDSELTVTINELELLGMTGLDNSPKKPKLLNNKDQPPGAA